MRIWKRAALCACASLCMGVAHAQFRGGQNWTTTGGDGERTSWIRTDPKISVEKMGKGFGLAWKVKTSAPDPGIAATLESYIGYRGFRSLAFMASPSGELTAIDTDLGRIEWTKALSGNAGGRATAGCPAGMSANVARLTTVAFPSATPQAGRGGGGRGGPAKSAVGESGEGSVILAQVAAQQAAAAEAAAARGRGAGMPGGPGRGPGRMIEQLYSVGRDGMLHVGYSSNGEEPNPAMQFVPAGANAHDLTVVNGVAYVATSGGCGGAPNGVWALDLASKNVVHWSPANGDLAGGGFAFGPDAKIYAATTPGDLVALDPQKLEVQGVYRAGTALSGSPVVFEYKTKPFVAVAAQDGHIHVVDGGSMTGTAFAGSASGPLGSYADAAGARFVMGQSKEGVSAWKIGDQSDAPKLASGWSAQVAAPVAPIAVNGVVFVASSSPAAVLHALDGATGKELWNSGKTMTAALKSGGISAAGSQVYVGTSDGTIYAFGFPIEH